MAFLESDLQSILVGTGIEPQRAQALTFELKSVANDLNAFFPASTITERDILKALIAAKIEFRFLYFIRQGKRRWRVRRLKNK